MGFLKKLATLEVISSAKKLTDKVLNKFDKKDNNEYIKVGGFIDDLIGENYKDVKQSLISYGFTNVAFVVKKDLKKELKKGLFINERNDFEDGEVEKISINGETEFNKNAKFLPSAKVAIIYHTYIGAEIEEEEEKFFAKCSGCGASIEYSANKPVCPYCNTVVEQ